jgi:hypothetical protein
MANSAFLKSSISLDSPVFTTKITAPMVVGGTGTTATLTLKGTSNVSASGSTVLIQPTGGNVGIGTTPVDKLDVEGNIVLKNSTAYSTSNARSLIYFGIPSGYGINPLANMTFTTSCAGAAAAKIDFYTRSVAADYCSRMTIDAVGNVGIGTATPNGKLHVAAYSATAGCGNINISNTCYPTSGWAFRIPDANAIIDLSIDKENGGWSSVMYFKRSNGYIGIGTTCPAQSLDINGSLNISGAGVSAPPAGLSYGLFPHSGVGLGIYATAGGITFWGCSTPSEYMRIYKGVLTVSALATGSLTSASGVITSSSDQTLKIADGFIDCALPKIMNLTPRYFYWNEKSGFDKCTQSIRQLGFYAQEVNKVLGEEVANTPEEGKDWGYYDRGVIAMLTKAMQEQEEKINKLINRIEILENK